jgi:hypothetical protein
VDRKGDELDVCPELEADRPESAISLCGGSNGGKFADTIFADTIEEIGQKRD